MRKRPSGPVPEGHCCRKAARGGRILVREVVAVRIVIEAAAREYIAARSPERAITLAVGERPGGA